MNLNLLRCYFSMNSWLDQSERIALCYFSSYELQDRLIRKNSFEVVSYPTNNFFLCSPLDRNLSDSSSHVEGWLYDSMRLHQRKYGPQASFSSIPTPLVLHFINCYLVVFIVPITKMNIYYPYYTSMTISSPNQCTYTIYHCILCVGDTTDFLLFGYKVF